MPETPRIIDQFIAKAIAMGANALEIEYKYPEERVFAYKESVGVGIASFRGEEGKALRAELLNLRRRKLRLVVDGMKYSFAVSTFDSFGETAFRVEIAKLPLHRRAN